MKPVRGFSIALAIALIVSVSGAARAEFPERPITLVIPWAVGGITDQTTRVLAKAAETHLGQPIVITNRPGATSAIGLAEIASAAPDGYTIGTLSTAGYLLPLQGRKLPFDPSKAFSYVSYMGDHLVGVVVKADSPWRTIQELIDDGLKRPGAIKYGSAGIGGVQHLTAEYLQFSTKSKFTHVPLQGSAATMPAILGQHVDFVVETSVWAPFVEDKQVRLLAVNSAQRSQQYPDVPTLGELGLKSIRSIQAIIAPAGVPEPIRAKLEQAFRKALSDQSFRETMARLYMEIIDLPGDQVGILIKEQTALVRPFLEDIGKARK